MKSATIAKHSTSFAVVAFVIFDIGMNITATFMLTVFYTYQLLSLKEFVTFSRVCLDQFPQTLSDRGHNLVDIPH